MLNDLAFFAGSYDLPGCGLSTAGPGVTSFRATRGNILEALTAATLHPPLRVLGKAAPGDNDRSTYTTNDYRLSRPDLGRNLGRRERTPTLCWTAQRMGHPHPQTLLDAKGAPPARDGRDETADPSLRSG